MLKEKRCCYQQRFSCINGLPIQTLGRFSHLRPCTLSFLVPPKTSAHRPHRSVTSLFPLPARRFFLCVLALSHLSFPPKTPAHRPHRSPSLPYFHLPPTVSGCRFPFSPLSAPSSCRTRHFFSVCHRPCRQPSVCLPPMCAAERRKKASRRSGGLVVCPAGRGEDDRGRGKARGVCQVRWVVGSLGG